MPILNRSKTERNKVPRSPKPKAGAHQIRTYSLLYCFSALFDSATSFKSTFAAPDATLKQQLWQATAPTAEFQETLTGSDRKFVPPTRPVTKH
jgi:hypothetical protein